MSGNDSSTGGFLLPADSPAPLEGEALEDFIQEWLVGVSGLEGKFVRPRWQAEPGNIPDEGTCWCAFGADTTDSDHFPFVGHVGTGDGNDQMQRHENISVLCSFYDLGGGGRADFFGSRVRDGAYVAQNREALQAGGMDLVETSKLQTVPSLTKNRWLYRADLRVELRRIIIREYPVRNVASAGIELIEDVPPLDETISVTN